MEFDWRVGSVWNKTDTIDILGTTLGFAQKVEYEPLVDFLVLLDVLIDLEDEPASEFVVGVLPGGIDALPEIVNSTDIASFSLDLVTRIGSKITRIYYLY
jgi:hypothetical protein